LEGKTCEYYYSIPEFLEVRKVGEGKRNNQFLIMKPFLAVFLNYNVFEKA